MNFEGEKGDENVEKVRKLETFGIKIKEIGHNPDSRTYPIVGYFPSGYDPLMNSDDPDSDSKSKPRVKVYRSVNSRNPRNPRTQVVVGASGSLVDFVGTNYSAESTTTTQLCNYALGVLDKETGVLKMVPIASNRIFRLEPKVRELMDAKKEEKTKEDDKFKILTNKYSMNQNIIWDEKRETLIRKGEPRTEGIVEQKSKPKKKNKEASTAAERKIPPCDVEATSLDKSNPLCKIISKGHWKNLKDIFELAEAGSDVSPDVHYIGAIKDEKRETLIWKGEPRMEGNVEQKSKPTSIASERNIPPYDVEATSPDMAYPLNKIIFKGDWKNLEDIFEIVEDGSDVSPDVYPTFVCNRVHKIGAIKDKEKRKRMAGILSYITHLIKYKDSHSLDGVSSTRRHKLPSTLAQRFSSLFSETEDKRIQYQKQQLLISYVLVLSLFADDFRSDMSDIANDLRMSPILLRDHYKYLGCKISEEKVVVATLSVPLEFQTKKRKRRR